jgi:hypothetical protein
MPIYFNSKNRMAPVSDSRVLCNSQTIQHGAVMARIASRAIVYIISSVAWPMAWSEVPASASSAPALYEITTETGMPHLEENLRYTTTHERRCVARTALFTAFPILAHPSLKGCVLRNPTRRDDLVSYTLVCDGTHGTTGRAIWRIGARRLSGTLNIKLGGKNMTFYQRITAVSEGQCTRNDAPVSVFER